MLEQLYKRRMTREMVYIDPHVEQLVPVEAVEDGKIVKTSEWKKICFTDNFKQFTSDDFTLSSIRSVGAVHLLRECQMRNTDAATFGNQVAGMSRILDEMQNQEVESQQIES